MPQEPKKKHSKARKRTRRAAINLTGPSLVKCPDCKSLNLPHQTCRICGFYKGKKVSTKTKAQVSRA